MAKTRISEYDAVAANNTDVNSINIAEGCAPSGINNAIRQVMADLKDFQQGTKSDPFLGPISTSSLTASSLTANRVLYTNGSKVMSTSDNMQFDGTTTTINALTVSGAFAANGGTTLGDGSGDALTINSSAVSIPNGLNFDSNTLVIDATNNAVGIGTASPAVKLDVNGHISIASGYNLTWGGAYSSTTPTMYAVSGASAYIAWNVKGSTGESMRIDSSGNVGIGTSSPAARLDTQASGSNLYFSGGDSATGRRLQMFATTTTNTSDTQNLNALGSTGVIAFQTNSTERMRITSGGEVAIGKTQASESAQTGSGFGFAAASVDPFFSVVNANASGGNACIYLNRRTTGVLIQFGTNSGSSFTGVGYIAHNGTSTSYNTSSDYRLKDNVAPMTDALSKVTQLKPCTYTWKSTGASGQGFIAHELQEIFPDAVSGEKDALDKNGDIAPQGIDTSYLVATLTAAIQEQQAIITDLKSRIEALENK